MKNYLELYEQCGEKRKIEWWEMWWVMMLQANYGYQLTTIRAIMQAMRRDVNEKEVGRQKDM